MIDFHCHILPGIDDGARNTAEAIKIAKTAEKEGVSAIIATPHYDNGVYKPGLLQIKEACVEVNRELKRRNIRVSIYPGAEARINERTMDDLEHDKIIFLAGETSAVLFELPQIFVLEGICSLLRKAVEKGIVPVIAHPERNPELIKNPHYLDELERAGAMMQLTAGSLLGDFGGYAKKTALLMVDRDLVHFVGSDMHPGRKYRMAKFRKKLLGLVSRERADAIFEGNAMDVLFQKKLCQNF